MLSKPQWLPKRHPPPSLCSPWGPERVERLGEQRKCKLHVPRSSAPSHTPTPAAPPQLRPGAASVGGSRALTFVTVMQELRGAAGARARRAGAAAGVRSGPGRRREGVPRGSARSQPGRLWALSPRPAGGSAEPGDRAPARQRAGTALRRSPAAGR